ncbi:bifunctional glutamate N-acetyltransferase/amino-acid acetyltransferase ArgJ [Oenococcus kitaharae]|uniref:Arginine biosynthesis bifunctional protein ArgJ n=1 Tax=Oenococcus kitaharae DSM 17330 TaxID=1045004 RepID=G9WJD6_9LACO|nr:bifunctional glutamate N-acetyltransferase/amino-acid acetyltransferase ArgJ [Oenococcus kitaharae]EHN58742.1 Glutamate N-acetyltransferase [Oenococcus kitaharae DSM 17330]OEY81907.1 N-acetylglutamate synthase [Oenococcus kitaharae]OEY82297.1 N-acetylglutamate synthase [Oenococcus kitaharae]OEY82523.1 N-acetylglutamate synthase [Oenococcus kitaharae]
MEILDKLIWPKGFSSDGLHANLRHNPDKPDLGWIVSDVAADAAGVFTLNQFPAAPVVLTQATVKKSQKLQAVIVNSANANSFTGQQGYENALSEQEIVAKKLGIKPDLVAVSSTGIIGEQLPMAKMMTGIAQLQKSQGTQIAQAIMTTDTKEKVAALQFGKATMTGMAKGSGMIHPNMGTMLSFICTDASIDGQLLQKLLRELTEITFNQITIDGDTSTNDMLLVLANGQSQEAEILAGSPEYDEFKEALYLLMKDLAIKIAEDGEGASKLVTANVSGSGDNLQARMIAKKIVGSNLVKAAAFGEDPNWGRVIDAIGNAGVDLQAGQIALAINQVPVIDQGEIVAENLPALEAAVKSKKIVFDVSAGRGLGKGQAWGSDLTYDYVKINAMYRT